jgi:hypothetical protein
MKANVAVAARTLALDLATGEVTSALQAAGIDCLLLKGPAMARRLYPDAAACRNYGDIDLLVAPRHYEAAGRVLAALGFTDRSPSIRASEAARLPARAWRRDGAAHVTIDLHRGFHHVTDRSAWWDRLTLHREVLELEGQAVAIPDRVGCAVIAALHAAKRTSPDKPLEDLGRAIRLFDDKVWREAALVAGSVGARDAFAAALCRVNAGAALAARLGLTVTDPVAWFRATAGTRGASALSFVLEPGTWADRARRVGDVALPPRAVVAGIWPIAARGRSGLAVAHLGRLCVLTARLPPLLLAWHRTSRALPLRGAGAARPPLPAERSLRVRARAATGTGWWTLREWCLVRRRLRRGPEPGAAGGGRSYRAAPRAPHSQRAERLVLACCRATCLETALVRQARAARAGIAADVIVGVTAPADGFRAHAWLDGDRVDPAFAELWRCPPTIAWPGQARRGSLCPYSCRRGRPLAPAAAVAPRLGATRVPSSRSAG